MAGWNQTWMRPIATVFGWQRWMNNDRFLGWDATPDLAKATWEWPLPSAFWEECPCGCAIKMGDPDYERSHGCA